jgi:hypothetical protein
MQVGHFRKLVQYDILLETTYLNISAITLLYLIEILNHFVM